MNGTTLPHAVGRAPRGLTASTLKLIACVSMVIDHVGAYILTDVEILRVLGRLAFPIFAFFIAEGCRYTRRPLRRFLMVFGLGLVCEAVYYIVSGTIEGGILITFSMSIVLIHALRGCKKSLAAGSWGRGILWGATFLLLVTAVWCFNVYILRVNYGFWGVMLPVFAALPDYREGETPRFMRAFGHVGWRVACFSVGLLLLCITRGFWRDIQTYSLFALPLLALYNGRPGARGLKYGFYVFYPGHLVVIYAVDWLLQRFA